MAHYTTSRRNLAATDLRTTMDPSNKKQPKSAPFTTTPTTKPHQDPTSPSLSIHAITKKFTNLYQNPNHHHKGLIPPSKSANPHPKPSVDTQFQSKSMAISANEDASSKTHLKSSHLHRKSVLEVEKERLRASITGSIDHKPSRKSHEGCEIKDLLEIDKSKTERVKKLASKKGRGKMESHEGCDIKRALVSLSRSQELELKESHENMRRASFSVAMSGGRRRSICNPQAELGDFFKVNGVKIVSVDMPPFMQVHAVDCARKAHDSLEKFTSKTLALTLKKEFDGVYGPAWHCIVGSSFGSFVTHSVGGFMYFSMDQKLYILLFKTAVQRAD